MRGGEAEIRDFAVVDANGGSKGDFLSVIRGLTGLRSGQFRRSEIIRGDVGEVEKRSGFLC